MYEIGIRQRRPGLPTLSACTDLCFMLLTHTHTNGKMVVTFLDGAQVLPQEEPAGWTPVKLGFFYRLCPVKRALNKNHTLRIPQEKICSLN